MARSATRRAVPAGWLERSFSQNAPTNLKSLNHKPRASAAFGAGLSIFYRITDVQRIADIQTDGFASRY
jgi:hypothetical protein